MDAPSIKQALNILRKGNEASGYHYTIGDRHHLVSVEQFQGALSVTPVKSFVGHSNHYVHERFAGKTKAPKGSRTRYERIYELNRRGYPALKILFDTYGRPFSIYTRKGDEGITLSTVHFQPAANRVTIYNRNSLKDSFSLPLASR